MTTIREITMDYNLSRAIAQAVRNRFLTTEAQVSAQGSPCGIYGGKVTMVYVFLPGLQFPLSE
jgi:hypothetical protein